MKHMTLPNEETLRPATNHAQHFTQSLTDVSSGHSARLSQMSMEPVLFSRGYELFTKVIKVEFERACGAVKLCVS